jgi:hypothetical protein
MNTQKLIKINIIATIILAAIVFFSNHSSDSPSFETTSHLLRSTKSRMAKKSMAADQEFGMQQESFSMMGGGGSSSFINTAYAMNTSTSKYIIKRGDLYMEVQSIKDAIPEIKKVCDVHKAEITSERHSDSGSTLDAYLTVRVPAEKFDDFITTIAEIGLRVTSQSVDVEDVSKDYIDTEERKRNRELLRDKYRKLLTRAKNVKDTLDIERELTNVQSQIDSAEGRLRYYREQIAKSTLNINIQEIKPTTTQGRTVHFWSGVKASIVNGWYDSIEIIIYFFSFWPWFFILLLGYLGWRRQRHS